MFSKSDTIQATEIVSKFPTISWPPAENGKKYKFTNSLYDTLKKIIETVDDGKMSIVQAIARGHIHTGKDNYFCLNYSFRPPSKWNI